MLIKQPVSVTEEKRICTGLIVSTDFCKKIVSMLKPEYFTNSYLKTISMWSVVFFESYGKAPYMHIKDIFQDEINAKRVKDNEAELIETLLKDLDSQYSEGEINLDYWLETANDYFRTRELEITINNISVLKENGDLAGAELELENYKKVTLITDSSALLNPGDIEIQERIYKKRDEEEVGFFKLPGDLGRYLGNQKRGDVVGYFAPAKKGKSYALINNFKYGVLSNRKTLFYSIEMTDTEILPRINQAFFPMIGLEEGYYEFPVFDCKHNQDSSCVDRLSPTCLEKDTEGNTKFDPSHVVCTQCKNSYDHQIRKKYSMETYKETIYRKKDDIFTVRDQHTRFQKIWNKYARISVHPKYSLTYDIMMRDIDVLYQKENWFPDIIIIDYIDILGISSKFDDYRLDDEKWKLLAQIAGKLNTLVITATQANKAGHTTDSLDSTHQGGFYGKNRHVNLMVGLNQKPEEKEKGIMNFGITEARSIDYIPGRMCAVLQDFKTGQAYLDSYYK